MPKPKKGKAKHALLTLAESDFRNIEADLESPQKLRMGIAAAGKSAEEDFLDKMPGAVARKLKGMIPKGFELSQFSISGDVDVKPLNIGVSGTMTATFTRKKPVH
jgi:hypothetical protein